MTHTRPIILLPEVDDPVVARFIAWAREQTDLIYELRADSVDLKGAAAMLRSKAVDAVIVGATYPSKEVFLTAIREVGASNKDASSFFIMEKADHPSLYFADCAVNPNPNARLLARIAEQTAYNVRRLGEEPVLAFLSYSTQGSAGGESVQKVQEACQIFREQHPELAVYGELQWDAAINESIYKKKNNGEGYLDGKSPNVFIFPNLDAGNMMYKALENPGGYTAVGPLTQGLDGNADFHDLSRGVTPKALERICERVAQLVKAEKSE